MAFWTAITDSSAYDAKRNHKFRMIINNFGDQAQWYVKKVTKPSFTFTEATHKFMGKSYYFPGRIQWNTISVTLVDPINPDATAQMAAMLDAAGYTVPSIIPLVTDTDAEHNAQWRTLSKGGFVEAMGDMEIQQLNSAGEVLEIWKINQFFIKDVKFSELSYESDDLSEITIEFKYDWAELSYDSTEGPGAANELGNPSPVKITPPGKQAPETAITANSGKSGTATGAGPTSDGPFFKPN